MNKTLSILSLLFAASICSAAFAEMTVVSVKGDFAALKDGAWIPLAPGAKIAEGTKVCTGTGSNAAIKIDDQTLSPAPVPPVKLYKTAQNY